MKIWKVCTGKGSHELIKYKSADCPQCISGKKVARRDEKIARRDEQIEELKKAVFRLHNEKSQVKEKYRAEHYFEALKL